ncbi:penicillin acylase family protein [Lampropedia puyangensis]|uniref:Penicillin acylase family protein n=2 Tax=Lampropedia puyangensis TaxID=1330072 RepID=A0A4S8F9B2_9BURK|nr:penicillin acylase family protein [Lampropedia puyangensis]
MGLVVGTLALVACGSGNVGSDTPGEESEVLEAQVRRTSFGIPHVKAQNWQGLGYGVGYAQAADNLCTIANGMLTYRGERSRFFGAQALPPADSTIGDPSNLESDFYHRHVLGDARIDALKSAQSQELRALVRGYTIGFNRYVVDIKAGNAKGHEACASEPWVRALDEDDVWRRMHAFTLAGGYAYLVSAIARAQPPEAESQRIATAPVANESLPQRQAKQTAVDSKPLHFGGHAGIGSNAYAFGGEATGTSSGLLFGNPHWYWRGPDRFYQQQMTLDGQIDVSGVAVLGQPVMLIGFNNQVAWSHTVSTARRFGLYQYTPDPQNPAAVLIDGKSIPLEATPIAVEVLQGTGERVPVTRTLYRSAQGPMIDLGEMDASLGWSQQMAFAIRDVNEDNYRSYQNWLDWARADSLKAFIAAQVQHTAMPWVNTIAAARGDAQVWYADMGNIPNVSEETLSLCRTPIGEALAEALPAVPVLNGSQSECQWQTDPDSVQAGSIGASRLPAMREGRYVANMNDSFWLTNPERPLEGYPAIVGFEQEEQSLRTRLGHTMVRERLEGADGYGGRLVTSAVLQQLVLNNRNFSAELLLPDVLAQVCDSPSDLVFACEVLGAWDGRGEADSRGAILWQAMWAHLDLEDADFELFAEPFDPARPIDTPSGLNADAVDTIRAALRQAVEVLNHAGIPLNAAKGELLFSERGGERTALYGGCDNEGYFTILCSQTPLESGSQSVDEDAHGNSYMQIVDFNEANVQAFTMLSFSQSDDPASPHASDYTRAYAAKLWHRVPFAEADILADPQLSVISLRQ